MSRNIFVDIGFSEKEADDLLFKTDVAINIVKMIRASGLSQNEVAKLAKWTQPKVSALMGGDLDSISVEKLLKIAQALNYNVNISFDKAPKQARMTVQPIAAVH